MTDSTMRASQSPLTCVAVFVLIAWNLSEFGGLHPYDQQRILQLYCFSAISASLLIFKTARVAVLELLSIAPGTFLGFACSALVIGLLSAVSADLPLWSLIEWAVITQLAILALSIAGCRAARPDSADAVLALSLTFSAVVYTLSLLTEYFFVLGTSDTIDLQTIHPHFSNPRFAGQMFTVAIPLLLAFSVTGRPFRVVTFSAASILLGFSLSQGTRGTWLALLTALAFVACARPTGVKRYLRVSLASAAVAGLVYLISARWLPALLDKQVVSGLSRVQSLETLTYDSGRMLLWEAAARHATENPWLGIGPMNFAATSNFYGNHPHSSLLQILSEWGIPATVLCTLMVGALIWSFTRASREPAVGSNDNLPVLRCGVLAALIAALVQSMVDGMLVVPTSQVMLFVLFGWAGGLLGPTLSIKAKSSSRAGSLLLFAAIATAAPLFAFAVQAGRAPEELRAHYCGYLQPRFWVSGRIGPNDFPARPNACRP